MNKPLINRGASPLELDFNGDATALPEGTKLVNGRVVVEPNGEIPEIVWNGLSEAKQNYLRQTGHIQEEAA